MENQQNPLQEQKNSLKRLYNKPYSRKCKWLEVLSFIFNLIAWTFLILIIISHKKGHELNYYFPPFIVFFGVFFYFYCGL